MANKREGWSRVKDALKELKSFDRNNGDLDKLACGRSFQHWVADEELCRAVRALANIAGCPSIGRELVEAFDNINKDYGDDY